MRRIVKVFLISIVLGLVGLGASSTREPWGVFQGFPFAYSYPNPITCRVNPFNGCGYYYDPVMVVLDYLFWLGTAVVGVLGVQRVLESPRSNRCKPPHEWPKSTIIGLLCHSRMNSDIAHSGTIGALMISCWPNSDRK